MEVFEVLILFILFVVLVAGIIWLLVNEIIGGMALVIVIILALVVMTGVGYILNKDKSR